MVLVLDLGLGERGLERDAPIDGLLAAVDQALLHEGGEGAQNVRLEGRILRAIAGGPIGQHAEPLELRRLAPDPALGELVAPRAQFGGTEGNLFFLQLARDLLLDGQPVAVPARNVRGSVAPHRLIPVDEILQRFVESGADVDVAVGERRAVVQHENPRAAGSFGLDPLVEIEFAPMLHPAGFTLRQPGPHGEIGARQMQGVLQVGGHAGDKGARS